MRISLAPTLAFGFSLLIAFGTLLLLGMPGPLALIVMLAVGAVAAHQLGWREVTIGFTIVAGILALIAAALFIFGPQPAFAQAVATSNPVDLNPLADAVTQVIVDIVLALGGVLALWLSMELKAKWGIDVTAQVKNIEANDRDALHSAVTTWANAAKAKFGPALTFSVGSPEIAYILNGVAKSAPDAVAALQPTENWIIAKAAGVLGVTPVITP